MPPRRTAAQELFGRTFPPGPLPLRALRNADMQVGSACLDVALALALVRSFVAAWSALHAARRVHQHPTCLPLHPGRPVRHTQRGATVAWCNCLPACLPACWCAQEVVLQDESGRVLLRCAIAYGFRNIQTIVRKMKTRRCEYHYVEVRACMFGCVPMCAVLVRARCSGAHAARVRPPARDAFCQAAQRSSLIAEPLPAAAAGHGVPLWLPGRRRPAQALARPEPPAAAGAAGASVPPPGGSRSTQRCCRALAVHACLRPPRLRRVLLARAVVVGVATEAYTEVCCTAARPPARECQDKHARAPLLPPRRTSSPAPLQTTRWCSSCMRATECWGAGPALTRHAPCCTPRTALAEAAREAPPS